MNRGELVSRPKRIAMYVIYDKDGILDGFRKYYLTELRKEVDYIVGVVSGTLTPESREELEQLTDDFFVRENKGLLAGSWVDGLAHIGWDTLAEYDELFMLNDSFFGPFYPLSEMMEAMENSDADFYGCMKNFEEKDFTQLGGRGLKHGHFRGSISYFYIIKSKLLHSSEFQKYWSKFPTIKEDWDTYFYAEIDFYDYLIDAGFKIDAYQGNRLKGYTFDNLTHNMRELVECEKIPFARIRPFCTDLKDQSMQINYGQDPRKTLEYIDKYTEYDVNLIWDYLLRSKNLTHIYNQLQLEYVVSKHRLDYPCRCSKKVAVILHIYYKDCVEKVLSYCKNFPLNTHFYITSTTDDTLEEIENKFSKSTLHYICKKRPNVGVAMSTLWVTYADVVTSGDYDYICYFHDKKSPYSKHRAPGEEFALRCYDNLFGTEEIVQNILNLFEENPRMGILGAPVVYHGGYYSVAIRSWLGNYKNTVDLAEKLDIKVDISPYVTPVAPYGDMFWFRPQALSKAIGKGLSYKDFDVQYKPDFTFMHAIERIYGFAAQDAGFYYGEVINSDNARSDLINYQYVIQTFSSIMLQHGFSPNDFSTAEQIVHIAGGSTVPMARKVLKTIVKARCPAPLWKILKKIYHFFGGKKWVG